MEQCHYLIIGGGILGLALAKRLVERGINDIIVIDKEPTLGQHASGRNSGVLHAGVYYPEASLKARFCLRGNQLMQQYCQQHGIPYRQTGKVIVTRHERELAKLHQLYERARANGAQAHLINRQQLTAIEPYAQTTQNALYVEDTCVINPQAVMQSFYQELQASGQVRFLLNTGFVGKQDEQTIQTNRGPIRFNYLINSAGCYADRVARAFGLAHRLRFIPFKGIYYKLQPGYEQWVRGNIYPVPDLRNPFLGVHFTKDIHGHVLIGPTAIPALGRENYRLTQGINGETLKILGYNLKLLLTNPKFRSVAYTEPLKYLKYYLYRQAKALLPALTYRAVARDSKAGIRPQLINTQSNELVSDFHFESTTNSLHILNAISPAFTSALAMAEYLVDEQLELNT